MSACPCQSQIEFAECCEPVLKDPANAVTAESLMRARYTAFTLKEVDFLFKTHDPKTLKKYDMGATKEWATAADFTGLKIKSTERGTEEDNIGWVEFEASYSMDGEDERHQERSEFNRRQGVWYYTRGRVADEEEVVVKVGRNEPCPCDSGKKYKKCCGAN